MKTKITVELETSNMNEVKEIDDVALEYTGDNMSSYIEEKLHKAFVNALKTAFENDYMEELILEDEEVIVEGFEYMYDYGDVIIKVDEEIIYDSEKRKLEDQEEYTIPEEIIDEDLEPIIPKEDE